MTKHLSPQQFVDVLETRATPALETHLAACASCAARLADLREVMTRASGQGDVPEPSPLFWDHFSARVRAAVDAEPVSEPGWRLSWRPLVALGAMAVVAALVVWMRAPAASVQLAHPAPVVASATPTASPDSAATVAADDEPWNLIVELAGNLPHEDLHEVVPPSHGTAGLVEDLTPEQRAAFVRLVKQQMGGTE